MNVSRHNAFDPGELLAVLSTARAGDLSVRMREGGAGVEGEVAAGVNAVLGLAAQAAALRANEGLLRAQEEELALSSRYKREFLANLSHELRTPLNSLLILARLLTENREGNLDARQVEFARTIHGAGADLLALIDDMLDLSKLESGTMFVEVDDVPIDAVRAYVERTFRPLGRVRGLDFSVTLAPTLPPALRTDPRRLQQVLKNLLANAFKFTERGGVSLEISPIDGAEPMIAFAVSDSGIGIPEDKQEVIFQAFQQADGSTSRRYGGTGLGLSISRELARLLGGEIRVQSAPGEGSTFTLLLPRETTDEDGPRFAVTVDTAREASHHAAAPAHAEVGPLSAPNSPSPDPVFVGRRVLVVDDDVRNIFAITGVLERQGITVSYAEDHRRGVERLVSDPTVDAVLMEAMIPGSDGAAVLREIRAIAACARVPILALTTRATGVRERLLAAGATDCIARPVDPDTLLALLRTWFAGP